MDVQVAKLKDGAQQADQVEETVTRIEALANETAGTVGPGYPDEGVFRPRARQP